MARDFFELIPADHVLAAAHRCAAIISEEALISGDPTSIVAILVGALGVLPEDEHYGPGPVGTWTHFLDVVAHLRHDVNLSE
jgi:hypothetical protein